MKKLTYTEKAHKGLIRKLHVLLAQARIDDDGKREILQAYGVEHSTDLRIDQLVEICDKLESLLNPEAAELDILRKRVIASIGGWLELTDGVNANYGNRGKYIKEVACRSTGYKDFNAIPAERLRNVYNTFCHKQRDFKRGMVLSLTNNFNMN